jgi:hypothetical protein
MQNTPLNWNQSTSVIDGQPYTIGGLNIWDFSWKSTGERFLTNDPIYQNAISVDVYEIHHQGKLIRFGAIEISNMVWLIYS